MSWLYTFWFHYAWPSIQGNGPEDGLSTLVLAAGVSLFWPPVRSAAKNFAARHLAAVKVHVTAAAAVVNDHTSEHHASLHGRLDDLEDALDEVLTHLESITHPQPTKEQPMTFSISGFGHIAIDVVEAIEAADPEETAKLKAKFEADVELAKTKALEIEQNIVADLKGVVAKYAEHFGGLTFSGPASGSTDLVAAAKADAVPTETASADSAPVAESPGQPSADTSAAPGAPASDSTVATSASDSTSSSASVEAAPAEVAPLANPGGQAGL